MVLDLLTGETREQTLEEKSFFQRVYELYETYCAAIIEGRDTSELDNAMVELFKDNYFPDRNELYAKNKWLCRARHHREKAESPYVAENIGMNRNKWSPNRWNDKNTPLIYLCKGYSCRTPFAEIEKKKDEDVSLGFFRIKEQLRLVCIREDLAVYTDANIRYGILTEREAALILLYFKQNWFVETEGEEVYKITNHFGTLLFQSGADGILYTSAKTRESKCIALNSDEKIEWRYSVLYRPVPNDEGSYRRVIKQDKNGKMIRY